MGFKYLILRLLYWQTQNKGEISIYIFVVSPLRCHNYVVWIGRDDNVVQRRSTQWLLLELLRLK
jgi:hypothetical protein